MSKRIQALEEALGTPLLERLPRRIELTEAGRVLHARCRHILREVENTTLAIRNLSQHVQGILKLATSHHIGIHYLPGVIRDLHSAFPDIRFDLHFMTSEQSAQAVLAGEVELALCTLPAEVRPPLEASLIWDEKLVFVAGREHPLHEVEGLSLSHLVGQPNILPSRETYTFQRVAECFEAQGLTLSPGTPANFIETIRALVEVNLGWSVLPAFMAKENIQQLPLKEGAISRPLGVLMDARRTRSSVARAFLEALQVNR
ncbi:MAG: LysR family transcriptional regulator [Gammaproteobacteria bacterium]|nr:MAG: LysR family transcriptional regulator [Gammaproteobacteria bacterium]